MMSNESLVTSHEFIEFLKQANSAGYANESSAITTAEDGTHEVVYEKGGFRFHDTWWGGEPFSGQEYVSKAGAVIWAVQYRGQIESEFESLTPEIYKFLRRALREPHENYPLRGPGEYKDGEFLYAFTWGANPEEFRAIEKIWKNEDLVFTCNFMGGLVNSRNEDVI